MEGKNNTGLNAKRGVSNKWLELKKDNMKSYAYVVKDNVNGSEEIMNARNVLKRPPAVNKNAKDSGKSDFSNEAKPNETNAKKQPAWKKSTTSNETRAVSGADEIRQLRNVLKRPGANHKLQIPQASTTAPVTGASTTAKPASNSQSVENSIGEAPKPKKLWKKKPL